MLLKPNGQDAATIINPAGQLFQRERHRMRPEEARTLRDMETFCRKYGYMHYFKCAHCAEMELQTGCRGETTNEYVNIECRCRELYFKGPTI